MSAPFDSGIMHFRDYQLFLEMFCFEPIQSTESMGSTDSLESVESMDPSESMDLCGTQSTVDLDVLTPEGQWDEPPRLKDSSGFGSKFKESTDQGANFDNFRFDEPDFVEQSLIGYNETSPLPLNTTNEDLCLSATIRSKFNLNSPPSQMHIDRNLHMNTKLCPVEPAEISPKKALRSPDLSNVLKEREQGGDQSKSMADENGMECRDYQIPLSQNLGYASKHHRSEDVLISIEAPPLPCATKSVINTTSGQDLTYDQQQSSSPSPVFRLGSETCSWISGNETDWADDESDDAHRTIGTLAVEGGNILSEEELLNLVTRPVLSKLKQQLVDRIMVEFWQIFNQENEINIYEDTTPRSSPSQQCQEQDISHGDQQNTVPASKPSMKPDVQVNGTCPTSSQNGKRKRRSQDEDENDETEKRNPKRLKGLLSPPRNQDNTSKFACPYRKHDAKTYCVRHWRSCALTPLETVARVKAHLYRHHRIFPCQRCKKLFNDQQGVNDHLMEPKGCKLLEAVQQDGITNEMVEKLRSKKKAHRDQSEEDRWKEIYQILFPGEMVPSPFFEEVQEDVIQSPDSQELADYEEYCRRELPRVFRVSLEEVVNNKTQPLEEQLRSQLMDLIRNAQDQVFSKYRSSSITTRAPARSTPSSSPQTNTSSSSSQGFATSPLRSQSSTIASSGDRSQARLPPFFQPLSPKNHLESGLDISDPNIVPSNPDRHDRSDSGYDSSSFVMPSTLPLTLDESNVNTSASSSQTLLPLDGSQETTGYADSEAALTQAKLDSYAQAITGAGSDHLNAEPCLSQNTFDFEFDYTDLSNFDTSDEFGNCNFSQNLDGFC